MTTCRSGCAPNRWGLYDLCGNVAEWCWDHGGVPTSDAATDPRGPAEGVTRVLRGGSWRSGPTDVRVAARASRDPAYSDYQIGFRVVRSLV